MISTRALLALIVVLGPVVGKWRVSRKQSGMGEGEKGNKSTV